jgi:hypothetical protein
MRRIAFHIICGPFLHQYGVDLTWALRRDQKKKKRVAERGRGGKGRSSISDIKEVEINVG